MKQFYLTSLLCAFAATSTSAFAEPEVLAPAMPQFYTNGLLGVPAYGSFVALDYVPGTQLWPQIALAKGFLTRWSIAILGDASPSNVWRQSADRVVIDRLALPKIGLRLTHGIAGASGDARDYDLEQRCRKHWGGILRSECGADSAGAVLPGLTVSLGVYGQTGVFDRIDGVAADLVGQYQRSRWLVFLSSTGRYSAEHRDDFGATTLATVEVGTQAGVFVRAYGSDFLGSTSITGGFSTRYLWSNYASPSDDWSQSSKPDSLEIWASISLRAGRVALSAAIGQRTRVEGPFETSPSTLARRTPVMLAVYYSL